MDMKIDALLVRAEREKRAWSQEHLAEVAGVALRTVQRVEATGSGSLETVKALASVFGLDVAELRTAPVKPDRQAHSRTGYVGAAAGAVLALFALLTHSAAADQLELDVNLAMNGESLSKHHMLVEEGASAEIRLEGQVRVLVIPKITSNGVMLSVELYEFADRQFVLAGTPKLLAGDDDEAEVNFTSERGNTFRIGIKPRKI
jgi:transcriptional regulator with XRE-family HTH domain